MRSAYGWWWQELCGLLGIQVGAMPQMEFSQQELNESLQMVQFEKFFVQLSESLNLPVPQLLATGSAAADGCCWSVF